ncbi:uncharacterized protein MYCFIDRAFT_179702 [Pseudocercospora fijiensis CIRAD86]|uniref:Uncharacterized protein n=1 Tax=Pseudocercospora fijiensis (strain CIRAD86) TaxID=383855 RepID=M3AJY6_PSEFD|nr:uncharacterized protein MYCFIDRAFT_179702 [Pseudocercospora fijiensis CIRAD86]EME77488.1 hypothetical protein MYCFIDRAFT_179702 [Pseudocercospora fijiensis CIRAD86]
MTTTTLPLRPLSASDAIKRTSTGHNSPASHRARATTISLTRSAAHQLKADNHRRAHADVATHIACQQTSERQRSALEPLVVPAMASLNAHTVVNRVAVWRLDAAGSTHHPRGTGSWTASLARHFKNPGQLGVTRGWIGLFLTDDVDFGFDPRLCLDDANQTALTAAGGKRITATNLSTQDDFGRYIQTI